MTGKPFYYLIDGLSSGNAEAIARALGAVPDVLETTAHVSHGVIEVKAVRDVEAQVRMACGIARTTFRMRLNRRPY